MPDEVSMFSVQLGGDLPDAGGGSAIPPASGAVGVGGGFNDSLGRIAASVSSIERLVSTIASTIARIDAKITGLGAGAASFAGAGVAQAAARAASPSSRVRVDNITPIGMNKSITRGIGGMGVMMPRETSNLALWGGMQYRRSTADDVIDVDFETVYPQQYPGPIGPEMRKGRGGRIGRAARRFGFNASSFLSGLSYGNPFVVARAFGFAGLTVAAPYVVGRLLDRARESGLATANEYAAFNPANAQLSAQVHVATLQKNIALANNPTLSALAAAQQMAEIRYQQQGALASGGFWGALGTVSGTFATNLWNQIWMPNGLGPLDKWGKAVMDTVNDIANAMAARGKPQPNLFYETLDGMTNGLLGFQERVNPGERGRREIGNGVRPFQPLSRKEWRDRGFGP